MAKSTHGTLWVGPVREQDDFQKPITDEFIDGRLRTGQWAIMSPASWKVYGIGSLGTGYGQRYRKNPFGNWVKVEG